MKHIVALAFIVVVFFIMTFGYEAIVLPGLAQVNPAAVRYFQVGSNSVLLPPN
jgi:hypothetical protein